jgi:glutathione S-transferase
LIFPPNSFLDRGNWNSNGKSREGTTPVKIYYAPNTRAVRIVWLFEELGLPYEIERFKLGDASMRDPNYLKIHPMARVPALQDGETVIFESGAIVEYVLAKYGNGRLAPGVASPDFRTLSAMAALCGRHDHAARQHDRRRDDPAAARPAQSGQCRPRG